jgi:gas vesicle protein
VSNTTEERDQHGIISLLAGVGVGLVLGGMAALLLAPQSGEQTRAQIRESADDAVGRLRQSMEELRVKMDSLTSRISAGAGSSPGEAAGPTDETSSPAG